MKSMNAYLSGVNWKVRVTIVSITLIIISSCVHDYKEHFWAEHSTVGLVSGEYRLSESTDNISILPNKDIKKQIIDSIVNAKKRVWIEIYMWTDKDIMNAVIHAYNRGVDVRVLMERNVYSLPRVNIPIYTELERSGVPVKYTDSYRFTFTHAKFWIIDDGYSLSSGNLTKSFFESNRDFIFSGTDKLTLDFLSSLFLGDFSYLGIDKNYDLDSIVLSPLDARAKIEHFIRGAQNHIILYIQTLTDKDIIDLLAEKQQEGIHIQVCTADNESNRGSYSGSAFPWILAKKPYLHGKAILVDGARFFVGSQNLTKNSLENNREVGIIIRNSGSMYSQLEESFKKDCIFK